MIRKTLRIADDLELPVEIATDTSAILARKGAGKTYTAAVLAEEDAAAGIPFVVLDPMGAFWGLRSSADGKAPGLPVTILGGEHGDVPLEPTGGKIVADLVVDAPSWYVVDLSGFDSNAAQDRFATDFAERLYRRKAPAANRAPLHLIIDEADSFAPQRAKGQERMLGAYEAIARRGRIRGIGSTWITQRPAVLNKNVLTQAELLICLQITSPQDRAAVKEWADGHSTRDERDAFIDALASLKRGEAWVWSPSLLDTFRQIKIRTRHTWDSSSTPTPGQSTRTPTRLAAVDLDALRGAMADTIERAEATDPKRLQARIRDLERTLADRAEPATVVETVEVPVVPPEAVAALSETNELLRRVLDTIAEGLDLATTKLDQALDAILAAKGAVDRLPAPRPTRAKPSERPARPAAPTPSGSTPTGGAPAAFLAVLSQFPDGRTRRQLALQSGYKLTSSTFRNGLSTLKGDGLIDVAGATVRPTDAGLDAARHVAPLPEGAALVEWWRSKVGGGAPGALFDALLAAHPRALTKPELAEASGYSIESSTFRNGLSKLRTLELVERGDPIALTPDLDA